MPAKAKSRSRRDEAVDEIELARRELEEKIAALEQLPAQLEMEMIESETTMPPPDDIVDRQRQRDFEEKAARGQIRNERRTQGRSLLLMFLLLAATAAMISWIVTLSGQ
ncbi:hypothetical protein HAHE_01510 [Haloferula helveola]|uniref:Uncharacterized protein n=1 Tax=Haloferula helveola TaxID=490095 RepID=A0ABM7RA31_9BACT|nr:hypothetical protein HAHE_01510 [Haloferula helveola]